MTAQSPWFVDLRPEWERGQTRRFFELRKEMNNRGVDEQVLSLTLRGVVRNDPDDPEGLVPSDYNSYQILEAQDLVFKLIDLENRRTSRVGFVPERGIMSPAYIRLVPRPGVVPRYGYWYFYSLWARNIFNELGGGVRATLGPGDLLAIPISLPPVEEQRRIADFLDDQVARIEQVLSDHRSQLFGLDEELLSEWNTRALELDSKFRTTTLRRALSSIVDGPFGSSLTSNHYTESGTRVIRLGNIGRNEFLDVDKAFISNTYADTLSQHAVIPGDLLVAGLGDAAHPLGRATVAPADLGPAIVKADCYRVRLRPLVDASFAAWYLSSPPAAGTISILARGSTRARLNTDVVRDAPIVIPPLETQAKVVRSWSNVVERHEAVRATLMNARSLLEERKRAVITAAVTGELDVTSARPIGVGKWVPNVGASVDNATAGRAQAPSIGGIG